MAVAAMLSCRERPLLTPAQTEPAGDPGAAQATLDACDREPIHMPGSIQPHGLLLVADAGLAVVAGAGALEERLAPEWLGRPLSALVGHDVAAALARTALGPGGAATIGSVMGRAERFDVALRRSGGFVLAELEPSPPDRPSAASVLGRLDTIAAGFERMGDMRALCERAAGAFRDLTGFGRVMIYRFLDDGAGEVIGESRDPATATFMNHRFPASDIPRQARALYVRNRVRVIPDVAYAPQPIRPEASGCSDLDLSDVSLRSVSPVHVQYLRNMGVAASASVSIVKDNVLWGLVACHHHEPRRMPFETRAAAQALAGALARQIRAREDLEASREHYRLHADQDALFAELDRETPSNRKSESSADEMRRMFGADGFARVAAGTVETSGACPMPPEIRRVARWVSSRFVAGPFATFELSRDLPEAAAFAETASGLLALNLGGEESEVLLWFRAEEVQVVEWAGNPHKAVRLDRDAVLTPRTSFAAWSETVRGRARPWSLVEIEAAARLRRGLVEIRRKREVRELNRRLTATLAEKDALLGEKDFLIKEVNHRVQNSLQLVSAFLGVQARNAGSDVAAQLKEAQRRLAAVALVHRRLYRSDSIQAVDLSRYLLELCEDMKRTMGAEWAERMSLDIAPMLVSADRAVTIGLVLTELVINAAKYAYGGGPGPLAITLDGHRNQFRLVVADRGERQGGEGQGGGGKPSAHEGFGTQMIRAMVERLSGTIDYAEGDPGLRVIVMAPLEGQPRDGEA